MSPLHVIGIGLDGAAGLTAAARQVIANTTLLVGSDRHLGYFPDHPAEHLPLEDLHQTLQVIQQRFEADSPCVTILVSGDPLFFGLGRLLLAKFPAEQLTFHPHLSSVQLAFSRVKLPWQDAQIISAHGRSLEAVSQAAQQGAEKIAILTDGTNTPGAIARLLLALNLPYRYQAWVCENLGGENEQVQQFDLGSLVKQTFAPLNVVILQRTAPAEQPLNLDKLPSLGIADHHFLSFGDRPNLMTKREVRVLALAELALQPQQVVWDIGAGTGSVSVEMARLCPGSKIYAIEQTAAGLTLIQQNSERFQVNQIIPVQGKAPAALQNLPNPDRVFIGGSGGNLLQILNHCGLQLSPGGIIVLALATLEHLTLALNWVQQQSDGWQQRLLQVNLSRSVPIAALTRFAPLNPVTLMTLEKGTEP